jgi:hypothetical protein
MLEAYFKPPKKPSTPQREVNDIVKETRASRDGIASPYQKLRLVRTLKLSDWTPEPAPSIVEEVQRLTHG